jgi:hypothetical protein
MQSKDASQRVCDRASSVNDEMAVGLLVGFPHERSGEQKILAQY